MSLRDKLIATCILFVIHIATVTGIYVTLYNDLLCMSSSNFMHLRIIKLLFIIYIIVTVILLNVWKVFDDGRDRYTPGGII